jgi:putative membrane protein
VVTFVAGAVVGLLTVAHVVKVALARYRAATLTFLVSLMVGALRRPVVEVLNNTAAWTPTAVAATVGVAVVGAVAVLLADHYTASLDYDVGA